MREPERKCTICLALIDEEDLFCANCGAEAPRAAGEDDGELKTRETTHNFRCTGCGASMSYDPRAQTLRCPFCGSERLDKQADSRTISPHRVIPFTVSRQQADQITRNWLGTGWLRPSDLSDAAVITKMAAVYVPYWVFQVHTHTYWTADTSNTPMGARGDWFPLSGEHHNSYAGVLVGASGALTPSETHTLCPFHLDAGVPLEEVELENAIVEQFSVPRKYARPLARGSVEELERQAVAANYVPGNSRNVHANVLLTGLSSQPMLLPVWIMAYQYKQKTYRFLINGQTGQPHGTKPTSYWKIFLIVAAVLLGILAILVCLGVIGGAAAMNSQLPKTSEQKLAQATSYPLALSADMPSRYDERRKRPQESGTMDAPRTHPSHQLRARRRRARSAPGADGRDDRAARGGRAAGDCGRCGAEAWRGAGTLAAGRSAGAGEDDVRPVHSA